MIIETFFRTCISAKTLLGSPQSDRILAFSANFELLAQRLLDFSRALSQQPLSDLKGSPLECRPLAPVGLLLTQLLQLQPLHLGVAVDAWRGQRSNLDRRGQLLKVNLTSEVAVVDLDEVDVPAERDDLDEKSRALDHGEAPDSVDQSTIP